MKRVIATLALSLLIAGCDREPPAPAVESPAPSTEQPATEIAGHWSSAFIRDGEAAHQKLSESVSELKQAVDRFLANPGNDSHKAARDAWRRAHEAYKAVRLYQHLGLKHAPFEQTSEKPVQHSLASRLDLYPLEPGYLDAVEGYPFSGLVFSESVPITLESLNEQHQFGDETYVVFGFHAIEFLLWGENHSQETRRSWRDYQLSKRAQTEANDSAQANVRESSKIRRRTLLNLVTDKLAQDVSALTEAWRGSSGVYPEQFLKLSEPQQNIRIRQSVVRTIRQDVEEPLLQLTPSEDSENNSLSPESAFSRNTRADILAALQPLTLMLTPESAYGPPALQLSEAQFTAAAKHQAQLHESLNRLSDNLFSTLFGQPRPEDRALLQQAREHAAALREQLQGKSANAQHSH